ncbi:MULTISPECIES: cory-CC-star protein [Actinoalloteichus]|uniref:cory-CC-star protein n=1 Tax=Actinoalloteichus TaxID=65496 RepID=UPI000AF87954|nr:MULTISPECIES: cory-CC-star protein [Actinoalloteichus]
MTDAASPDPSRPVPKPVGRIRAGLRAAAEFHEAWFTARWRSTLRREARDQQDTLRALMLLDTLGVDSPVAYETLELVPFVLADLHEWHRRMGRDEYDGPGGCC